MSVSSSATRGIRRTSQLPKCLFVLEETFDSRRSFEFVCLLAYSIFARVHFSPGSTTGSLEMLSALFQIPCAGSVDGVKEKR
jgi:hypothetical protein